jgi:hypothetical protein
MKARFPIGLTFTRSLGKKVTREDTITDILTTTNSKGEVVRIEYVISHEFMSRRLSEIVLDVTIARNLDPAVLAQYC